MDVLRSPSGALRLSRAPLAAATLLFAALPAMAQSVAISEPTAGAQYLPNHSFAVIATAAAAGEDTVSNVEFFVDDKSIGMDRQSPFESIGLSGNLGSHKVHAVLTTGRGTVVSSAPVAFETVRVVELLAPLDGSHFRSGDAIPMQVTHRAGGSGGFLQFFADGQLLREDALPASLAELPTVTYDWREAPVGTHVLKAMVLSAKREVIGESTPSTVTVEAPALSLQLRAPANPLPVKQGTATTVAVEVQGGLQGLAPVGGVELEWIISGSGFPAAEQPGSSFRATAVAACDTPDAPSSGQVTTGSDGLANITFTPGCNGARSLWVRVLGRPEVSQVQLPFAQELPAATLLRALLNGAPYLVAEAGKAAALRVQAADANGNVIANAITDWTLTPSDAGTVTTTVNSGADGIASGSVTLSGQRSATARVCVRDQVESCIDVQIRSTAELITRPVQQIVAPIAQQSIETSRTQLGLLRSRLGQLRNEQGHGFCDGASVQVQGLSMPMCGGGGGGSESGEAGSRLGSFVMGNATLGKRNADGRWSGYELLTRGLTGGVDYRFSQEWVGGAALGLARGSVDVSKINTQDSSGYSGSLFGQWMPSNGLFATGVVSLGRNSFDIERRGSDQLLLSSETDSRQTAMQVELGYSVGKQALKLTPYARYELVNVDVDGLTENGGPEAVAVDPYSVRNSALSAGLSADYAISSRSGVWIPSLSVEFHNETQNLDVVHARLVNGRYGNVNVPMPEDDNRYGTFGFNLQWLSGGAGQPISSFIGYGMVFGRDNVESKSFTLGVKLPF